MTTYLQGGWFAEGGSQALRPEVIDGAMDIAGVLVRGGVGPQVVQTIALRLRGMVRIAAPRLGSGPTGFGERELATIRNQLDVYMGETPALDSFIADCLDHVRNDRELLAAYLHLVHVNRMMQLLSAALIQGPGGARPDGGALPSGNGA